MISPRQTLKKAKDHVCEYPEFYIPGALFAVTIGLAIKYPDSFAEYTPEPKPIFEATFGDKSFKLYES